MSSRTLATVLAACLAPAAALCGSRAYDNRLIPLTDAPPILADHPEFVEPVGKTTRFLGSPVVEDEGADLEVRAWRFSYNARGVIDTVNRLRAAETAVVVVHPWGIDDAQGWKSPEPAGVAMFCTPEKNRIYHKHVEKVVNPFLKALRGRVAAVAYSLPGKEDPIRRKLYRSLRSRPSAAERKQGAAELAALLKGFAYKGEPLPAALTLDARRPVPDYFRQFPGLDSGAKFNHAGFWDLPIPVVDRIEVHLDDVVAYDAEGYGPLRDFLKKQGVRHVLLAGYATDMCLCSTTAGYKNLGPDFNVFVVGDATLATFPASPTPRFATNAALGMISLQHFVTQASWVRPLSRRGGEKLDTDAEKKSLEKVIRRFYKGMASAKKEDRKKALEAILPTRKDILAMFPAHAEKLLKKYDLDKAYQFLFDHLDEMAKEVTRFGEVKKVELVDVRADDASGAYKRVLSLIPKDVPVYRYVIRFERGSSGGGEYLRVNGRWVWLKDIDTIPRAIDKLK